MIPHSPIIFTDLRPAPAKARARKSDPVESHDAAKRVELGKAELQRCRIASALALMPMTAKEVANFLNEPTHEIGKRIGEIHGIAPTGEKRNGFRVWGIL